MMRCITCRNKHLLVDSSYSSLRRPQTPCVCRFLLRLYFLYLQLPLITGAQTPSKFVANFIIAGSESQKDDTSTGQSNWSKQLVLKTFWDRCSHCEKALKPRYRIKCMYINFWSAPKNPGKFGNFRRKMQESTFSEQWMASCFLYIVKSPEIYAMNETNAFNFCRACENAGQCGQICDWVKMQEPRIVQSCCATTDRGLLFRVSSKQSVGTVWASVQGPAKILRFAEVEWSKSVDIGPCEGKELRMIHSEHFWSW